MGIMSVGSISLSHSPLSIRAEGDAGGLPLTSLEVRARLASYILPHAYTGTPRKLHVLLHAYALSMNLRCRRRGTVAAVMVAWVLEGSNSIHGPWQTLDHRGCSKNIMPMSEHQVASQPYCAMHHLPCCTAALCSCIQDKMLLLSRTKCCCEGHGRSCGERGCSGVTVVQSV